MATLKHLREEREAAGTGRPTAFHEWTTVHLFLARAQQRIAHISSEFVRIEREQVNPNLRGAVRSAHQAWLQYLRTRRRAGRVCSTLHSRRFIFCAHPDEPNVA